MLLMNKRGVNQNDEVVRSVTKTNVEVRGAVGDRKNGRLNATKNDMKTATGVCDKYKID